MTATSTTGPATQLRSVAARPIRLRPRSALAITAVSLTGIVAFGWPFVVRHATGVASGGAHAGDAPWIFVVVLPLLLAVVMAELADGGLDAKAIAMLGVLTACGAGLRTLGAIAGATPVFFLLFPAGRALGRGFGFTLGALTLFASALVTGTVGPWLPFQMLAAAWVGLGAGCLPPARGRLEICLLAVYGAAAGLVFGALTNLWFWPFETAGLARQISYVPGGNWLTEVEHYARFYLATSLGWDLTRAAADAALVLIAGRPVLNALRRIARRAAFGVTGQFVPPEATP